MVSPHSVEGFHTSQRTAADQVKFNQKNTNLHSVIESMKGGTFCKMYASACFFEQDAIAHIGTCARAHIHAYAHTHAHIHSHSHLHKTLLELEIKSSSVVLRK